MSAKSNPVTLGTSDTDIYVCPATFAGFVQLEVANIVNASRTYTLKFYKASTAATTTFPVTTLAALAQLAKTVAFSMEAGDKIIGSASAVSSVVVNPVIDLGGSTAARGFTPRGEYAAGTTYAVNDVVSIAATGNSYLSMQAGNIGNAPASSPAHWMLLAEKGLQGDTGVAGGSSFMRCRVVAVGAESYLTDFENGDTIDGVVLVTNDVVLRASATAPERNGPYVVQASGAASRHPDFASYDAICGAFFSVLEGTAYADTLWRCTSNYGGTLNTTALVIPQYQSVRYDAAQALTVAEKLLARANINAAAIGVLGGLHMTNGKLSVAAAANALTASIKTLLGADPSAADPVSFYFPDGVGGFVERQVTAALSLVITSGSSLGTVANIPFRIHWRAVDDAGTVRLAAYNAWDPEVGGGALKWPDLSQVISCTAEGGAGAADASVTFYSNAAVTAKYSCYLGYSTYENGLATAGTWSANPTITSRWLPGMRQPGDVVQRTGRPNSTEFSTTLASYQTTNLTRGITIGSKVNSVRASAFGSLACSVASQSVLAQLHRDAVAIGSVAYMFADSSTFAPAALSAFDRPNSTSLLTYSVKIQSNGTNSASWSVNSAAAYIHLEEIWV